MKKPNRPKRPNPAEEAKPPEEPRKISPGDEIAGNKVVDVRPGTNGKTAIIGRNMKDLVVPAGNALTAEGRPVELFTQQDQGAKTFVIDGKEYTWNDLVSDMSDGDYPRDPATGYIPNDALPNTAMYKANQQWAEKLNSEGYEVIDMGYPPGVTSESTFFNMERGILFPH